jgi:hypothetical protein
MKVGTALAAIAALALAGCSVQRAVVANDTQQKMVGMTKEEVLACMGPPVSRMAEGSTEVWSYPSGDGRTTTIATATTDTRLNATGQRFGNTTDISGNATRSRTHKSRTAEDVRSHSKSGARTDMR